MAFLQNLKYRKTIFPIIVILLLFSITDSYAQETKSKGQQKIFLIRHARVDQQLPLVCTASKAVRLHEEYNQLPICSFDPESVRKQIPGQPSVIYSSSMDRAIQTAIRIFPDADTLISNSLFDEYSLPMISIPLVPLPYPVWTSFSRFFWLTRLNTHKESHTQGLKRAKAASDKLEELAQQRGTVIVVCHGYIIRDMRQQLQKRGWHLTSFNGNKNLSVTELSKDI